MNEWADISTLTPKGHELSQVRSQKVDIYSKRWHIRWPDCGWSENEQSWWSRSLYLDEKGRRTTTFHIVADPSHWLVPTPTPDTLAEAEGA